MTGSATDKDCDSASRAAIDARADKAFEALTELFSKGPNRSYRKWHLTFKSGEPVFERDEFDLLFDQILYGDTQKHLEHMSLPARTWKCRLFA